MKLNSKYKAIALDIDGTLTTSKKVISKATKEAVLSLQINGVKVIVASGRSEYGFRHIATELQLAKYGNYLMSFNGGRLIDCAKREVIFDKPLPLSFLSEIYEAAKEFKLGITGYEDDCLVCGNSRDRFQDYDAWACKMKIVETDDFPNYFKKPFNKCLLTGEPNRVKRVLPKIQKRFEGRLNVFKSEDFFIEVLPYGVDKASALEYFTGLENISREELVCIGDGPNDVPMIEYAGAGVAMANASQVLIDKADYVTDSNDRDGVQKAIKKFFYNKDAPY